MSLKKITDKVYQIGLGAVNCFLVADGDGYALVDCGYEGSGPKIFEALGELNKQPKDLTCLILTHSHPDHAGSAAYLQEALQLPVIMHAEDAALARQGIAGRPDGKVSPGILNWLLFRIFIASKPNAIPAFSANRVVADGEVIPIGKGIRVIHTPGHSAGHIALLVGEERLLLAGDICSNIIGLALSIIYEDRALGVQSVRNTARYDFDIACFGHGQPVMSAANRKLAAKFN